MSGIIWELLVEDQATACAGFTAIDITSAAFKVPMWKHFWRYEVAVKNNLHNVLCLHYGAKKQACLDQIYGHMAQSLKKISTSVIRELIKGDVK